MIIISHRNPHFRCISLFSCGVFLHLIPETVTHVSICSHNLYKMTVMVLFTACYKEHLLLGRFPWQHSRTRSAEPHLYSATSLDLSPAAIVDPVVRVAYTVRVQVY